MASIYENLRTNRQYSASTGLNKIEFENLEKEFSKVYQPKKTLENGEKKQPVLTNTKEALFFILFYLKTRPTYQVLGMCFNISDASAQNYIERIKPYLQYVLKKLKMLPVALFKNQKEFDETFLGCEILIIDCTEIVVERAEDPTVQKDFYSGKKKLYDKNTLNN